MCHLTTINHDNDWPHCVPVSYLFTNTRFYVPSAPDSKKIANLKNCKKATIEIDDVPKEFGIMIECDAEIITGKNAEPFKNRMKKEKGWENNQATLIVELTPVRKVAGLKSRAHWGSKLSLNYMA